MGGGGRAAADRELRLHVPQGRCLVQEAGRRRDRRPADQRPRREAVQQVVHVADSAARHQHELSDVGGHEGAVRGAQRQGLPVGQGSRGARNRASRLFSHDESIFSIR
ncbi:hypothetical protein CBM2587_A50084 [Cupriavidus taiwanensis]|uniref:Uncharacterized protein n=1 Tax=Cupriavidus taiwanensis TaxID=164546 RepID=A0A375BVE1_9BURK|nr:hypothetical protein CBM2587_A50084 [Cupriavidus taiwanensis]